MKNQKFITFVLLLMAGLLTGRADVLGPYTPDTNTLILLHFDDSVGGSTLANAGNLLPSHNFYSVNSPGGAVTPQPSIVLTNITTVLAGVPSYPGFGNSGSFIGVSPAGVGTGATNIVVWDYPGDGAIFADPGNGVLTNAEAFVLTNLNIGNGGQTPWTIEAMINTPGILSANGANANSSVIISTDSGGGTSANLGYYLRINPTGTLEFQMRTSTAPGFTTPDMIQGIPTAGPDAFVPNQWFHVAVTYDGIAVRMYWTRVTPTATSAHLLVQFGSPAAPIVYGTAVGTYTGILAIGNDARESLNNSGFPGQIDEVRISSVARAANQFIFGNGVTIGTQPANQLVAPNATASFTVAATTDFPSLSYQWLSNGVALANGGDVSGVTTATLQIANAQSAYAVNYSCAVSDGHVPTDTINSANAYLALNTSVGPVTWNGLATGNWDNTSATNWYVTSSTTSAFFLPGDTTTFDDSASLASASAVPIIASGAAATATIGSGGSGTATISSGATATAVFGSGATATAGTGTRATASANFGSGATATASIGTVATATANAGTLGSATAVLNNSATATPVMAGDTVSSVTITSAGAGFTTAPVIIFSGGGGSGAAATATLANGSLLYINVTAPGSGYTSAPTVTVAGGIASYSVVSGGSGYGTTVPTVTLIGGGGSGATATAVLTGGIISAINVTATGTGYVTPPTLVISSPGLTGIALGNQGTGYATAPAIILTNGGGASATAVRNTSGSATATIASGAVTGITGLVGGSGYSVAPVVTFTGGGGSGAQAIATVSGGVITAINITVGGLGYTTAPTVVIAGGITGVSGLVAGNSYLTPPVVTISGGGGSGATATATLNGSGAVSAINIITGGTGYTTVPTIAIAPVGSGATATATVSAGKIIFINLTASGSGYTVAPTVVIPAPGLTGIALGAGGSGYSSTAPAVTITGGGGSGATATATVSGGVVTGITMTAAGTGYTSVPTVAFGGGLTGINITAAGSGYGTAVPTVTITGGGATTQATATAVLTSGAVSAINLVTPGTGYTSAPTVTVAAPGLTGLSLTAGGTGYSSTAPTVAITGGGGSGATATTTVSGGVVQSITLTAAGTGYTSAPTVTIGGGLTGLSLTAGGTGYPTTAPTVTIAGGGGSGATATTTVSGGVVQSITLTAPGTGYTSAPTVTITSGQLTGIALGTGGTGYLIAPVVTLSGGGAGTQGTATASVSGGAITGFNVSTPGSGYTSAPTVNVASGVTAYTVTSDGSGYLTAPAVTLTGGGFTTTATATAVLNASASASAVVSSGSVTGITSLIGGSGYITTPQILFTGGGGIGAKATATLSGGAVTAITITAGGTGYTTAPTVVIAGGISAINVASQGAGYTSVPTVSVAGGFLSAVTGIAAASGYGIPPVITVTGGGATTSATVTTTINTSASATAIISGGSVVGITGLANGSDYTTPPTIVLEGGGGTGAAATAVANTSGSATAVLGLGATGTASVGTGATIVAQVGSGASATVTISATGLLPVTGATGLVGGTGYTAGTTAKFANGGNGSNASATVTVNTSGTATATVGSGATAGQVTAVNVVAGGSGYTVAPIIYFTTGLGASATATISNGVVTGITGLVAGTGYLTPPTVTFAGGGGSGASATATVNGSGVITGVTGVVGGSGYTLPPTVIFTPVGSGAAATATVSGGAITGFTVTSPGSGYVSAPAVGIAGNITGVTIVSGGSNYNVAPTLVFGGGITGFSGLTAGSGYGTVTPSVTIVGGGFGSGAVATASLTSGAVSGIALNTIGTGYAVAPNVVIGGGLNSITVANNGTGYGVSPAVTILAGSGAAATATIANGGVSGITGLVAGSNYSSGTIVTISGGGVGSAATATATIGTGAQAGQITGITVTYPGSGYPTVPTITIAPAANTENATAVANVSGGSVSSFTVGYPSTGYISPPPVLVAAGGVYSVANLVGGSGYGSTPPNITFLGGGGSGASAVATVSGGSISSINVTAPGSGYTTVPTLVVAGGTGAVNGINIISGGSGYTSPPTVVIEGGISGINIVNGGAGYTSAPTITIASENTVDLADTVNPASIIIPGVNPYIINGSGGITGSGALTKSGSSKAVLGGNNSYTGGTAVNGGTLQVAAPASTITTGPVLYMSFDDVSGNTVINQGSGGSLMNGTLYGDVSIVSGGRYGNALSVPFGLVTEGYVLINSPCVLLNNNAQTSGTTPPGAWTVAMWIKTDQQGGNYFYQGGTSWASGNTRFYTSAGQNDGIGSFAGGVRNSQSWETGQAVVTDNQWHFVAMTTLPGNVKTLYVDGNVDAFSATNNDNGWNAVATGNLVYIGGAPNFSDNNLGFNGLIDEVYMYNYGLSQAQIQSLMNSSSGVTGNAALPVGGAVSVASGASLDLNGNNETVAALTGIGTVSNSVAGTTSILSVNNNTSAEFDGSIANTNAGIVALNKTGVGNLTLTGTSAYPGATTIAGGTLTLTGSITNTTTFSVASLINTTASVYQSAGALNNTSTGAGGIAIAANLGSYGYYNLSGGSIYAPGEIDVGGVNGGISLNPTPTFAQLDISGGTVTIGTPGGTVGWFLPNRGAAGSYAVVNIAGGTMTIPATVNGTEGFQANWGAGRQIAAITLSGAGAFILPSQPVNLNNSGNSGNQAFLNLNGGTLQTIAFIGSSTGDQVVSFNGGTLQAGIPTNSGFWNNNRVTAAYLYGGGGTINDNGLTIQVGQPLLAPNGNGVTSIAVATPGSGYLVPPLVTFSTGGGGSNATAYATINPNTGALTGIVVTSPGTGYDIAPTATLTGGLGVGGTAATVGAVSIAPNVSGGLTKSGSGILVLTNFNTYTGATLITAGTLALTNGSVQVPMAFGSISSSTNIFVANGARYDVTGLSSNGGPGYSLGSQILSGSGTVVGNVATSAGSTIAPGFNGAASTLNFANSLVLAQDATASFNLSGTATSGNDAVAVTGSLTANNNVIYIHGTGSLDTSHDYVLFTATGGVSGTFDPNPVFDPPSNANLYRVVTLGNSVVLRSGAPQYPVVNLAASVPTADNNQSVTLTATVTLGSAPSVNSVTLDESSIGGSTAAPMSLSGALTYTATIAIPAGFPTGRYPFTATVTDSGSLTGSGGVDVPVISISGDKWTGLSGATANVSDNLNWVGDAAPSLFGDSVTFAGTAQAASVNLDQSYSFANVIFDSTAGAFTISSIANNTLGLAGTGFINNSANPQTINVPVSLDASETISAAANDINFTGGSVVAPFNLNASQLTGAGSHNININSGIVGTGALTMSGPGTLSVTGQTLSDVFTGPVTAQYGTVNLGTTSTDTFATNNVLTTLNGGVINVNGVLNSSGTVTLNNGALNVTATGAITFASNKTLTMATGSGTIAGIITLPTPGASQVTIGSTAASNAVLHINGGVISNYSTADPSFSISSGGNGLSGINNGAGTVIMTGGTVYGPSETYIGTADGQYGSLTMSGGLWSAGTYFAVCRGGGWGVVNLSGGTIQQISTGGTMTLGSYEGTDNFTHAQVTVTGGLLLSQNGTWVGENAAAIVTVSGTGLISADTLQNGAGLQLGVDNNPTGRSILNVGGATGGGVVEAPRVYNGATPGIINFNGGIVRAMESPTLSPRTTMLQGIMSNYVYSGGAIFDANSVVATINGNLMGVTGYGITSIPVLAGGSGYIDTPVVQILTSGAGVGATATAVVNYTTGQLTGITMQSAGTGYAPGDGISVTLGGGGGQGAILGTPVLALNSTNGGLTIMDSAHIPTDNNPANDNAGFGGVIILGGSNSYTGPTTIPNGQTLVLSQTGSILNSSVINLSSGATFDVSSNLVPTQLGTNQQLAGYGTVNGLMAAGPGSAIYPSSNSVVGQSLYFNGGLTLQSGATVHFNVNNVNNSQSDFMSVEGGPLTVNGNSFHIKAIHGASALDQTSDYLLIAAGDINGAFNPIPVFDGTPPSNASHLYIQNNGGGVVLHYSATAIPIAAGSSIPGSSVLRNQNVNITVTITSQAPGSSITSVTLLGNSMTLQSGSATANGVYVFNNFVIPPGTLPGGVALTAIIQDSFGAQGTASISIGTVASRETWSGSGADQNWDTAGNWAVESGEPQAYAPGYVGDSLVFATASGAGLSPVMDQSYTTPSLTFSSTASPFNITASGGNILSLSGPGLTNGSANTQILNLPISLISTARSVFSATNDLHLGGTGGGISDLGGGVSVNSAVGHAVYFDGVNGYQGSTLVTSGTLDLTGSISSGLTSSITVGSVATSVAVPGSNAVLNISGSATGGAITIPIGGTTDPSFGMGMASNANGSMRITGSLANLNGPSELWLAVEDSAYGALTMSNGTLVTGSWLALARGGGIGIMNQSGGSVTVGSGGNLTIGSFENVVANDSTSVHGLVNLSGGTLTTLNNIYVGEGEMAVLNVTGGEAIATKGVNVALGNFDGNPLNCQLNLLGGTVNTPSITGGLGTGTLNFNGGIVQASAGPSTPFISAVTASYVYSGGAIIDDAGSSITVSQPLLAPPGFGVQSIPVTSGGSGYIDTPLVKISGGTGSNAFAVVTLNYATGTITGIQVMNPGTGYSSGDSLTVGFSGGGGVGVVPAVAGVPVLATNVSGGLTKNSSAGSGTLTLTGASTYTGPTVVNQGTLAIGTGGSLNGTVGLTVASGATFDASLVGSFSLPGSLIGGGTALLGSGGVLTIGGGLYPGTDGTVGQLTITGGLTLGVSATGNFDLGSSFSGSSDFVSVSGPLTLNGNVLHIKATTLDQTGDYVLITASGGITGAFASVPVFDGGTPVNAANFTVLNNGNNVVLHYSTFIAPTGTGLASPINAVHYQSVSVTVTVTPGSGGSASTIDSVTLNAAPVGGSSSISLTHSSGNTWVTSSPIVIPASAPVAGHVLVATITDGNGNVGTANVVLNVVVANDNWTGASGSDENWSDSGNWVGSLKPGTGDTAVFAAANTGLSPTLDSAFSLGGVSFSAGAPAYTLPNANAASLTLLGNGGGVTNLSTSTQTLGMPISLQNAPVFNATTGNLVVNGLLTDDGKGVVGAGASTNSVTFTANNNLTGPIASASGTTILTGTINPVSLIANGGILEVGDPGTLNGGNYATPIGLNGTGMFAWASSVPETLSVANTGTGGIIEDGPGTLTLTANNTYTGGTTVNGGNLILTPAGGAVGGLVATLNINPGGTVTSTVRDGIGYGLGTAVSVMNINGGTFNMTGDNNGYVTQVNMTGGTLSANPPSINNGGAGAEWGVGGAAGAFVGFTTLASSNSAVVSANLEIRQSWIPITVAKGTVPNGADLIISGRFTNDANTTAGVGGLIKTGAGTLVLAGVNNYQGGTTNSAGIIQLAAPQVGNNGPIGTGNLNLAGGTLQYSAANETAGVDFDYSARFATAAGQFYNIDTGGENVAFGTALTSSGATLTKLGLGTLSLAAAETYSGTTVVSNGTLALIVGGSINSTASISISSGATLDVTALGSYTLPKPLIASGNASAPAVINAGSISFGSQPITLTYDGADPALTVAEGVVTLTGNAVTINGAPLTPGTYTLVSVTSGTIIGTPSVTAAGTAIAVGTRARVAVAGSNIVLQVISGTAPTVVFSTATAGQIQFSWPADHLGWILQANSSSIANTAGWTTVANSANGTSITIPINTTGPNTFYRLVSPF